MSRKIIDKESHFFSKVAIIPFHTCWEWIAGKNSNGYGSFYDGEKYFTAHKWYYERKVKVVPNGFDLDHKCRNRSCVNPDHLDLVTHRENVLRGLGPTAINSKKTHCNKGHLFDEKRFCKICHDEYHAKYREIRRDKAKLYSRERYKKIKLERMLK